MHQNDASDTILDSFNTVILMATINRFTFIQYKDIQPDKLNHNQIEITFHLNDNSSLFPCGLISHISNPLKNIIKFTKNEVQNHQIVFYAINCENYLNKQFQIDFQLINSYGDYLSQKSIIISIQKNNHHLLPELEQFSDLLILPYTDTLIKTNHLSIKDKDTNPNYLIYIILKYNEQYKQYGQFINNNNNNNNETIQCFTQSQINSNQILFSSYSMKNQSFSIDLLIFDAGDIGQIIDFNQLCNNILLEYHLINKTNNQEHFHPFIERMNYIIKQNNIKMIQSNEPLKFNIRYKQLKHLNNNNNHLLINNAPKPDTLETILPGYVGFYLSSENIYTLNPWLQFKLLNYEKMNCELFNIIENKSIHDYFYQNDLNRRKLVVILLKDKKRFKRSRKKSSLSSSSSSSLSNDTVCEIQYEIQNVNQSIERKIYR